MEIYKPYLNALIFNNDAILIHPMNIYDTNKISNSYKQIKKSVKKIKRPSKVTRGSVQQTKNEIIGNNKGLNDIDEITIKYIINKENIESGRIRLFGKNL